MNACPTVSTGDQFLTSTLSHLDCQAQVVGSFGFQSLAAPGSPASLVLTALLTLFIALFAIRLLLGDHVGGREAVNGILKIGIVLTLAFSWPAFRIIAYDTVLLAPAEVASSIIPLTLPDPEAGFAQRLQYVDTAMASLTAAGTGRQVGSLELENRKGSAFEAIAMKDDAAFGWARTVYLASVIGALAILRVAGALLLALAPLFAGLLLFDFARGLFAGWARGLVLVALGSLGTTLLLSVQVAVMDPWLSDALSRRALGYATPSAPTELLALVLAFAAASLGLLFVLAKVAFQNAWSFRIEHRRAEWQERSIASSSARRPDTIEVTAHARALTVSEGVLNLIRHEEGRRGAPQLALAAPMANPAAQSAGDIPNARIGSSWRRTSPRTTAAQTQRDKRS